MRFENDQTLIHACLKGDQFAWTDLVERYRRLVWSVIRQTKLRPEDAEDVFQQVFLSLLRSLQDLRETDRLAAWLLTTTRRACWRASSKSSGAPVSLESTALLADGTQSDATEVELDKQLLRDALEQLGGKCRELLEALFSAAGEPSYPEIGERLGMRVGSIGPTRQRCLEKLTPILHGLGF